jgi:sec-independent protein translocase protein TatB
MFDASLPELMLVAVIGLLVLGPQRLPKVAAEIGKWIGRARRTATQLRRQLEREVELSELENPSPPVTPPPPRPTPPVASTTATAAATATATTGEVPPGPGTHRDQSDTEHSIGGETAAPEPPAGAAATPPSAVARDDRVGTGGQAGG